MLSWQFVSKCALHEHELTSAASSMLSCAHVGNYPLYSIPRLQIFRPDAFSQEVANAWLVEDLPPALYTVSLMMTSGHGLSILTHTLKCKTCTHPENHALLGNASELSACASILSCAPINGAFTRKDSSRRAEITISLIPPCSSARSR